LNKVFLQSNDSTSKTPSEATTHSEYSSSGEDEIHELLELIRQGKIGKGTIKSCELNTDFGKWFVVKQK
jgi:hypothetical protein